jgi:subtilisin family serine protease
VPKIVTNDECCVKNRVAVTLAMSFLIVCLNALSGVSQTAAAASNAGNRILVRMRPVRSPQNQKNKEALTLFMSLFESEKVAVAAGTSLRDLSRERCGRVDEDWISAALKTDSGFEGRKVARAATLTLPPCPFWGLEKEIKVPPSTTLSHQLLTHMGTLGDRTLNLVAAKNARSKASLNFIRPDEDVTLPYVTAYSPYTLKPEYRNDPTLLTKMLKDSPGFMSAMPRRGLDLIVAASDSDCDAPADESEWPFSTEKVRQILEYNNGNRSGRPLQTAVVAVADTGLDTGEQRLFLKINDRENPVPNNIDDDENGYIDDIQGANMDRGVPGFPALDDDYHDREHGTHVSGLVLGGLKDDALTDLVKERIKVQELKIARQETVQIGTSPPVTTFSIPNDYLLDAFRYAAQDPPAHIINLSVESIENSGLEEALAGTTALVIAAAGNDGGLNIDQDERYPAAAKHRANLLTVAAYDGSGGLARFSNWGKSNVDLAAPGCQIDSILPGGRRGRLSGTSQAAPLVAFTAALLYSEGLTIPQIRNRILLTTEIDHAKLGTCFGGRHCVASEGRLDIVKALDVYEDVLVVRNPDGQREVLSGRVNACVPVDGTCYEMSTELKRLVHDPSTADCMVWIKSRTNDVHSQQCALDNAANIEFKERGAQQFRPIPMADVVDLVAAVFR